MLAAHLALKRQCFCVVGVRLFPFPVEVRRPERVRMWSPLVLQRVDAFVPRSCVGTYGGRGPVWSVVWSPNPTEGLGLADRYDGAPVEGLAEFGPPYDLLSSPPIPPRGWG